MARWTITVEDGKDEGGQEDGFRGLVWMAAGLVGQRSLQFIEKPDGMRFNNEKFDQDARRVFEFLEAYLPYGTLERLRQIFRGREGV